MIEGWQRTASNHLEWTQEDGEHLLITPTMKSNRKRSLIVLAIVVIAAALLLILPQDRTRSITIAFVGFTNVAEKTFALFVATNTNSRTLRYYQHLEQMSESGWPSDSAWLPASDIPAVEVLPHQSFRIHVLPPAGSEAPWRVSLMCSLHAHSRLGKLRWRVANWFYNTRRFTAIGRAIDKGPNGFLVTGPEIRNEQQTAKPQVPVRAVQ
jgi:hypothetical protein